MLDNKGKIHKQTLEDVMSNDFGKYAKYIIQDRALPDIRDGLKPVQRRIIYAMNNLKLHYDLPHKKSARTVGEVIGKYHPHGDSSIYEAMVRMSQSWKNNSVLLDMHGNNGSIDGDGAAAMRYTECRLSRFGQTMIENIDKNTVELINNFDDSEKEPTVLPTLLPNLLINGASGIAAGYATNIPTFNFNEVVDAIITRIDSPNCQLKSIMQVMPGPDFPTGGIILNRDGILDAYKTGKGKITIRGKIELLNAKTALITSIPYETNKSAIIKQIDMLREKFDVCNISEVRDESDKNGINIVIELKNAKNFDIIKNLIYKNTQMQVSYPINMVAISDHKPIQFPILAALDAFIKHSHNIVISSSKFDLEKAVLRKEIVQGLIKAIKIIDDIVYLIRHSLNKEEAKKELISKLAFTPNQAEAIVNLRLYRLTNTDADQLLLELKELEETILRLNELIENEQIRSNFIKSKLREFKKLFGHERLSEISSEDDKIQIDDSDTIEDRDMIIIATRDGDIKSISKQTYSSVEYNEIKVKEGDIPVCQFNSNQRDKVILLTSLGNYITIPTYKIQQSKWKDIGVHLNSIISTESNEKIIAGFNYDNNINDPRCLLLSSRNGMIKRTLVKDLIISKIAKSSPCMKLDDNDYMISAFVMPTENEKINIGIVSTSGIGYNCDIQQISLVSRNAAGVKSMNLKNDDKVAAVFPIYNPNDFILFVSDLGMKRIRASEIPNNNRPSAGKSLISQSKSNPIRLINAYNVKSNILIQYIDAENKLLFVKPTDVAIGDATTKVSSINGTKIKDSTIFNFETEADNNKLESINNIPPQSKTKKIDTKNEQLSLFNNDDENSKKM